jgi:hypothetical protein
MAAFAFSASISTQSANIKEIIQRESPGVVAIFNFDQEGNLQSSGSGFIVTSGGEALLEPRRL